MNEFTSGAPEKVSDITTVFERMVFIFYTPRPSGCGTNRIESSRKREELVRSNPFSWNGVAD